MIVSLLIAQMAFAGDICTKRKATVRETFLRVQVTEMQSNVDILTAQLEL